MTETTSTTSEAGDDLVPDALFGSLDSDDPGTSQSNTVTSLASNLATSASIDNAETREALEKEKRTCEEERNEITNALSTIMNKNLDYVRKNIGEFLKAYDVLKKHYADDTVVKEIEHLLKSDAELKRAREREEDLLRDFPPRTTNGGETMSV